MKRCLLNLIVMHGASSFFFVDKWWLTCRSTSRRCSFTQFLKVFAWISTHKSSLPRIFMPFAAVPSGDLATRPACVIFWISVVPSALCCSNPLCVTLAPLGKSMASFFHLKCSVSNCAQSIWSPLFDYTEKEKNSNEIPIRNNQTHTITNSKIKSRVRIVQWANNKLIQALPSTQLQATKREFLSHAAKNQR